MLSNKQYGFLNGRSTQLQMLTVTELWQQALDEGNEVDVVYMDYQKAFDTVPTRRLLSKIESTGIKGKILEWTENFLTNRKQAVVLNGTPSKETPVRSGVPQGSVLGPTLFILYTNELPERTASEMYMYADDTKIFRTISNPNDKTALQKDLDTVYSWTQDWLLMLHPEKCKILDIGKTTNNNQ